MTIMKEEWGVLPWFSPLVPITLFCEVLWIVTDKRKIFIFHFVPIILSLHTVLLNHDKQENWLVNNKISSCLKFILQVKLKHFSPEVRIVVYCPFLLWPHTMKDQPTFHVGEMNEHLMVGISMSPKTIKSTSDSQNSNGGALALYPAVSIQHNNKKIRFGEINLIILNAYRNRLAVHLYIFRWPRGAFNELQSVVGWTFLYWQDWVSDYHLEILGSYNDQRTICDQ